MGFYRRLLVGTIEMRIDTIAPRHQRLLPPYGGKSQPFVVHYPSLRILHLHAMTLQTGQMCTFTLLLRALVGCFSFKWKLGQKRVVDTLFQVRR